MPLKRSQPVGSWKGKLLKPTNFDVENWCLLCSLTSCMRRHAEMTSGHECFWLRIKILKQILIYIYMPCYFVSNGVEMSMTNHTFDIIWNGFGNKELTDSETPSSSKEGDKTGLLVEKARNAEWRKQDDGYYNKTERRKVFPKMDQEKTKQPCVCDICGSAMSCKSNLAKHKITKKCQRFLVWVHYDFMIQEHIIKL